MKNTLIFFDVNGTIIKRDARTDIPFADAIDIFFDISGGMNGVYTSARSDKDVFLEICTKNNLEFSNNMFEKFLIVYEKQLKRNFTTDVWRENSTAVSYIKYLFEKGYILSLITGELEIGARYKLEKLGVWKYFDTGGFGEDGLKRFDIADTAFRKVHKKYDRNFSKIYVIGDTILDIKTARHLNAKIISISTGSNTKAELKAENPDFLIDSFDELNIF